MKRRGKKLALNRETIRRLSTEEMSQAQGAGTQVSYCAGSGCGDECTHTQVYPCLAQPDPSPTLAQSGGCCAVT